MSLLKYLQFQKIDDTPDEVLEEHRQDETIELKEQIDENALENYWDTVVEDIHEDPDWFTFS